VEYAAAVTELDAQLGLVLDALSKFGLAETTVVFVASDNGPHNEGGHSYMFFNSSGPLRGYKRSLHEGGHRTAFMARWCVCAS
jgi:arylsulfatase A-like enzyme